MKKTLLKILTAVAAALMPWPLAAVNTIIHTAYYNGNVTIGTDTLGGGTYATVHYDGLYNGGAPGTPSLPIDYIRFSVPYNATNFTVTAQPKNTYSSRLNYPIYPCQEPRMMNDTTPVVITLPDSAAYYSGSDYPTQRAWIVDEGFLAGENHIVTVAVMPIAYKYSATGIYRHTLKESHSVRLTLSYSLSDSLAMYPIVRNDSTLRQEGYALTQRMVANPSNVIANAPIEMTMDSLIFINPNQGDGLNGGNLPPVDPGINLDSLIVNGGELQPADYYPYLIVTTSDLELSVRRIAALKRQIGYNVKVVTMDEVMNDPEASQGDRVKLKDGTYTIAYNDNAGVLRQYLKKCFRNHGTKFVFLIGNGVPYRFAKISDPVSTDLYFSELNSDWKYSNKDSIDIFPDLYIGRLLAKSPEQISNYSEKLLRYLLNPGRGDRTYLSKVLYTEGHDMHRFGEISSLKPIIDSFIPDSYVMVEDTSIVRFPTGADIVNEINNAKYGYLSFHNHAFPSGILTYGFRKDDHCNDDTPYNYLWAIDSIHMTSDTPNYLGDLTSGNGLNNLMNKWYPNICYSVACKTMPFGKLPDFENLATNFGESFTTGKNYGGPAFLGNTFSGQVYYSSRLEECFATQIINGYYKLGQAEALSKIIYPTDGMYRRYYLCCVHNLLGDPDLEIWTGLPQEFQNIIVTRGNSSITVKGIDINTVPTTIVICSNNGTIRKMTANTLSVTFSNVSPNSIIMVYKHNYLPYIAPLLLQNENLSNSQYVIASDVTAGYSVDNIRTLGDVIVKSGIEYEIEASGTVTLQDGFKVEKGATFAVYPSSY